MRRYTLEQFKTKLDKIYCCDCLKGMVAIPDKSIDMILCDLPYGVTSRNKWDEIISFVSLWEQYERIITENKGERYPLTVIGFDYDRKKLHPTQKPVALFEYLIKTYTNEGDLVLDNCMGSGTTAVACKNLNRNFIGFETLQKYVDIANKRLSEMKG